MYTVQFSVLVWWTMRNLPRLLVSLPFFLFPFLSLITHAPHRGTTFNSGNQQRQAPVYSFNTHIAPFKKSSKNFWIFFKIFVSAKISGKGILRGWTGWAGRHTTSNAVLWIPPALPKCCKCSAGNLRRHIREKLLLKKQTVSPCLSLQYVYCAF